MNILDKITGKMVLLTGLAGAAATAAIFLRKHKIAMPIILGATAFSGVASIPAVSSRLQKVLGGFADSPEWPRFVALGSALVASVAVGRPALPTAIFLLTAEDGNVFDALY